MQMCACMANRGADVPAELQKSAAQQAFHLSLAPWHGRQTLVEGEPPLVVPPQPSWQSQHPLQPVSHIHHHHWKHPWLSFTLELNRRCANIADVVGR